MRNEFRSIKLVLVVKNDYIYSREWFCSVKERKSGCNVTMKVYDKKLKHLEISFITLVLHSIILGTGKRSRYLSLEISLPFFYQVIALKQLGSYDQNWANIL